MEGLWSVFKGDVGINSTMFFEALPGEIASSRLELRNEGNTSIFYNWRKLDVSSCLSRLLSHRTRSCFYFNRSSGTCGPRPGGPSPPPPHHALSSHHRCDPSGRHPANRPDVQIRGAGPPHGVVATPDQPGVVAGGLGAGDAHGVRRARGQDCGAPAPPGGVV